MSLFSKLFGEKETVFVDGDGDFDLEVVGESRYVKHLKKICGGYSKSGHRKEVTAELHYEDKNSYDNKAIRVDINGKTVGYLDREDARFYRRKINKTGHEGIIVSCNAVIVGGKKLGLLKRTYFGVWLDLPLDKL